MLRFRHLAFVMAFISLAGSTSAIADDGSGFKESFLLPNAHRWYTSSGWANGDYQACEWRNSAIQVADKNLRMTLSDHGGQKRPYGCAEIHTNGKLGYGLYEARMRSATGSGLNTAFYTYTGPPSGDPEWDEIDFEFLGKDPHTVQINHFTEGKPHDTKIVQLGFDASQAFHNYAFEWRPDKITWYVDGQKVAETPPGAAIGPMPGRLYLSLWSGAKGEDAWMGHFDYKEPVTADVEWVAYTPLDAACAFPESLKCKK